MPRITGGSGGEGVQAVVLALQILEYLAHQQESIGVTALAQALGTTKSRIYRHLRTLVQQGYIVQVGESEKYRVGSRLVTLGQAVSENFQLANIGRGVIRDLRERFGHFCVVSQLEADGMRVVTTLSGKSVVEVSVKQGSLLGFHFSAQGKIALAFGDESLRARVLRSPFEVITPHTITDAGVLRQQIDDIRRQGWATAPGETMVGVNALAAPVFGPGGVLVGAVAVVDSVQHLAPHPTQQQLTAITDAARRISEALGDDRSRMAGAAGPLAVGAG